ncbi:MAG: exosortase E/protease, VPEID-CTERM system [Pseudomonadota bacterium]
MSTTLATYPRAYLSLILRTSALVLLFLLQFEALEIALRSYYDGASIRQSVWAPVQGSPRFVFSFLFVFLAAFLAIAGPRLRQLGVRFVEASGLHSWIRFTTAQVLAYGGFIFLTYLLSTRHTELGHLTAVVFGVWALLLLTTAALALLALAPASYWRNFVRAEKISLVIATIVGLATISVTTVLIQSWPSMVDVTLRFSEFLLQLVYSDVIIDPEAAILGTTRFDVEVTRACAGYEGIALIIVFLSLYLWLFRQDLRFPRVLLLFPVGIAVMWAFNSLRIATLVAIGTSYSPEIAITGFHSNAGWIAFILVAIGLIGVMHQVPFLTTDQRTRIREPDSSARLASALLMPLVILLASTLITAATSSGFDWLYPLKVIATGAALWCFWTLYDFQRPAHIVEPIAIGGVVFIIWMLLVPASAERTVLFASSLADTTPWVAGIWLVFRFVGSAVTVPLAEELAFRGYILARLSGAPLHTSGRIAFAWLPFLGSSLLFGIFHGAWVAGTLAGLGYAIARYRRGKVQDAIVAHMTTNALLSGYVILTHEWSYW